jgi:hypothetical protein
MIPANKKVHIISGGTVSHVRPHMSLSSLPVEGDSQQTCSMAYGATGRLLKKLCLEHSDKMDVILHETRMACRGESDLETNEDVAALVTKLVADPTTKILFMPVALTDYDGRVLNDEGVAGKHGDRLRTRVQTNPLLELTAKDKIIGSVRGGPHGRKDITLVGWKAASGISRQELYLRALALLKGASCNLVFANDVTTKEKIVVVSEESFYPKEGPTTDLVVALKEAVYIAYERSHLTFTHSTVVDHKGVPWSSPLVHPPLRSVVDWLIERGAYKPFQGKTAGHFAAKIDDTTFLTSKRKTNFNDLDDVGLVLIKTDGPDTVLSYGGKPSVGGQSQRIIFGDHAGTDCIAHFHCPILPGSEVPTVSQREYECGSHECGQNTSRGLKRFGNLLAVYLDNHGPNIDPQEVINFIEANFDLDSKTGGPVSLPEESLVAESVA